MTLGRLAFAISAMDVGRRTSATVFRSGSLRVIRRQSVPPQPVPGRGPPEGAACALNAARAKMDAARMTCAARRVGRDGGIVLGQQCRSARRVPRPSAVDNPTPGEQAD